MRLFFDMEFTGLHKNTTPISLGIVSEDGKRFYAEFTDYDESQCNIWIKENVIDNLFLPDIPFSTDFDENITKWSQKGYIVNRLPVSIPGMMVHHEWVSCDRTKTTAKGTKSWVSKCLNEWLKQFRMEKIIQFVSDVCHYDFVLLIDILTNCGTALNLPENISAVCHDLNQDIAEHYHISDHEAFDISREQIMNDLCSPDAIVTGKKHNSLYDAEVIRAICKEVGKC